MIALVAALAALLGYRFFTSEPRKTAPLVYTPGMVVSAPVRKGPIVAGGSADPLQSFLERRAEKYPGMVRDIFRMANPAPKLKSGPTRTEPPKVLVTVPTPTAPVVPVKTPEEIAQDEARADLSKFRFLGYLTDKDSSLFLSKDGELFIVKSGDRILKNYQVKTVGKDSVVLLDTATKVEVRIELSGGEAPQAQPQGRPQPQPQRR